MNEEGKEHKNNAGIFPKAPENMLTYSQSARNHGRRNPSRPARPDHSLFLVNHQHYKPVEQAPLLREIEKEGERGAEGKRGKGRDRTRRKREDRMKGNPGKRGEGGKKKKHKKQGTKPGPLPLWSVNWLRFYLTSPKAQPSSLLALPHLAAEAIVFLMRLSQDPPPMPTPR